MEDVFCLSAFKIVPTLRAWPGGGSTWYRASAFSTFGVTTTLGDRWAMATHLRTELVLDALEMALEQRQPDEVIHHSDHGCQYTSLAFGKRCGEMGVRPSMGSVGNAYDNAMAESFFATLECELLNRRRFRTQVEARHAIFRFIEGWYNPHRRHSALGNKSPVSYEKLITEAA